MMTERKHGDDEAGATPSPGAEDESASPETVTPEELEALRRKAGEHDELAEKHLRMRADFENSRKRLERGMQERAHFAIEEFAGELLPVADNLARAIEAARQHDTVEKILEGVELVEKQLYDTFARHGVTPVAAAVGQPFDHNFHEAMGTVCAPDQPANIIMQVIQRGFMIHERLLRPAQVMVSVPAEEEETQGIRPEQEAST